MDIAFPFQTEHFSLRSDLDHLARVRTADAPEAIILYSVRILEVLAASAAEGLGPAPGANLFSHLTRLEQAHRLTSIQSTFFHALRYLGNDMRHITRRITAHDAESALHFLSMVLDWHLAEHGINSPPSHWVEVWHLDPSLARILGLLTQSSATSYDLEQLWRQNQDKWFHRTPLLIAMLAERFISMDNLKLAETVIKAGLDLSPKMVRLRQMEGLWHKRSKRLGKARQLLETLDAEVPNDEETEGMLAGTLKALWQQRPDKRRSELGRAAAIYYKSWQRANGTNTYVGINAASMLHLAGKHDLSQEVARRILDLLLPKLTTGTNRNPVDRPDYWEGVTLAEALLLLGKSDTARQWYRLAMATYPERQGDIGSTKTQLELILASKRMDIDQFLGPQ